MGGEGGLVLLSNVVKYGYMPPLIKGMVFGLEKGTFYSSNFTNGSVFLKFLNQ